jgi:hypothetical protein
MRISLLLVVAAAMALAGCGGSSRHGTTVSGARDGANAAELDVQSGADSVTVQAADLGGDLYRVTTPSNAGVKPSVVRDGNRVQVFLASRGSGPAVVTILVSPGVRWRMRFDGGAKDVVADLRRGRVSDVDFAAGDAHISLDLPEPSGTVSVQVNGGASEFALHVPHSTPVRVAVDGGAASVALDGVRHTGVAGGTVFTPPAWSSATNRYDVLAHAGVSALTLSG